jgi:hypothetical protein
MDLNVLRQGGNLTRSLVVCLAVGWLFASLAAGQEAPSSGSGRSGQAAAAEPAAKKAASKARAGTRIYDGKVVRIDFASRVLSVRGGGGVVSFDVSNPTLSGFKSIADIRSGDMVGLSYTESGIRIVRLSGKGAAIAQEKSSSKREPSDGSVSGAQPAQGGKQSRISKKLPRRQTKTGSDFDDVDANKDGKVSPVELSVIIPDITMDRFRQYNKSGRGYLDRTEFSEAVRQGGAKGGK